MLSSDGACGRPSREMRSGLATSRCPRSASTRITGVAILDGPGTDADRHINALPDHIHPAVGRLKMQRYPRIARHKSRQHRSDMDMQQGDRTGDPDATARLGAQRLDRLLRRSASISIALQC